MPSVMVAAVAAANGQENRRFTGSSSLAAPLKPER